MMIPEDGEPEVTEDLASESTSMRSMEALVPAPVVSDGNEEFPVPFARFAASLHRTEDEVWLALMQTQHGRENHKMPEWSAMLDGYRDHPAHPEHPDFVA